MNNSILQLALELATKIDKYAQDGSITDLDQMAGFIYEDCKSFALITEDHLKTNNRGLLPGWALLDLQNAAMMGHSGALFALGQEYEQRNQRKVADRCFLEAARRGHRQAAAICAQRDIQA